MSSDKLLSPGQRKVQRAKSESPVVRAEFRGYYNINLSKDQSERAKAIADSNAKEVTQAWMLLVEAGYTVTTRFAEAENCFLATAFSSSAENVSVGIILSQRATTLPRAIVGLAVQWSEDCQADHQVLHSLFENRATFGSLL